MVFYFYLGAMGLAILLSLFNLRRGDIRLTGLATSYFCVVAGFHLVFMSWLGLGWRNLEFYPLVAGAQALIAYIAYEVGCRAAKIIMPLALSAVVVNCFTLIVGADYPHDIYYGFSNFIQCAQIGSLIFASSIIHTVGNRIADAVTHLWDALTGSKRIRHEQAG